MATARRMRVYHSTASTDHDPKSFFRRGKTIAHPESAERYRVLHEAVLDAGFDVREAADHGIEPVRGVHTAEYVDFMRTAGTGAPRSIRPPSSC